MYLSDETYILNEHIYVEWITYKVGKKIALYGFGAGFVGAAGFSTAGLTAGFAEAVT